jgi:hypothetical protein
MLHTKVRQKKQALKFKLYIRNKTHNGSKKENWHSYQA